MNDFVLVGIFQINVALGILYIGLQQFRFRENLYDDIVQLINQHGYADIYQSGHKAHLLDNDSSFAIHYHTIREWMIALPANYQQKLEGIYQQKLEGIEIFEVPTSEGEPTQRLLRLHNWFLKDRDKHLVWGITIIPSLVALWLCLSPIFANSHVFYLLFGAAVFGQLILIVNALLGYLIVLRRTKEQLNRSLSFVMDKHQKQEARDEVKEAKEKALNLQDE